MLRVHLQINDGKNKKDQRKRLLNFWKYSTILGALSNLAGLQQITQYGISLCMPVKLDKRYNKSKAKIYA